MTTNKDLNFLKSFGRKLRFVTLMLALGNISSLTMAKSNATTTPAKPKEDNLSICRISPKNLRMDLRGSLIFNQKIYLITRDWLVYELPITNLHDSQMMINVTAKPIEKIWPALESPDSKFPKIKSNVEIIFSYNNNTKQELLFLAPNEVGVLLNLQTGLLESMQSIVFLPNEYAMLSNSANDTFYSISSNESVHDHIYFQPWKVKHSPKTNEIETIEPIKQYNYVFVDIGLRQILTEQKKDFTRVPIDFQTLNGTVMNGFIWNGYVHLFGIDKVYIFEVTALTTNGYPVELKVVDSSKYWNCDLVYKGNNKKIGMIVGITVALILIIVGVVVLCCFLLTKREVVKNSHNKETSKRSQDKLNKQKASYQSATTCGSGTSGFNKKTDGGGINNPAVATSAVCQQPISATVSNMAAIRSGEEEEELPGASASVVTAPKTVTLTSTVTSSVKQEKTSKATPTSQMISTRSSQAPTVQKMASDEEEE